MKDKKLLNTKEIAGSFLYIPSLQKQELLYRLLDKISIEENKAHIRCDKAYKSLILSLSSSDNSIITIRLSL